MREWRVVIALAAAVLIGLGALPATSSAATAVSGVWVVPGNNKNTISWEASSGNTHYRIYRSTTDGVTGSLLTTIVSTGTSYVDTTAANGTSYYYSVRGWDGAVESADPVPAMTDTGQTMTNGNHWWDDCSGVLNGTVFVFSGFRNGLFGAFSQTNTINQYDSVSNVASVTPYTMPAPSRYWCGADRSNGSLYLFGGASGDNGATRYSAIHQFNPTAGVTTKLGTLPTNRYQVSARTLADGTVVALGGENGAAYFQSLARFDPLNDVAAPLPSDETTLDYGANGVQTPGMGAIDGNLIISGGKSGTGNAAIGLTKTLTVTFGPLAYFRANQPNIAPNRYGAGVAELNDRYYSLGGATGGTPSTRTAEIDSFDPRAGTWRDEGAALPESRFRVTAHRIKGFIYVMGGNNGSTIGGTFYPDVYRFDPGGQARGTPGAPQFATAPSALNVTPGDHQASLSWTGGTLVDYYRIFRSTTSGALGTLIEEQAGGQDAPATSIVDLAARNCITYYYTVTGIGYDGHETGSTAQVATMGNGVCEAAGLTQYRNDGVTAIAQGTATLDGISNNVVIKFTVSHAAAGQTLTPWVEVRTSAGALAAACGASVAGATFTGSNVAAPSALTQYQASVNVTGLVTATTYYWRACAIDGTARVSDWIAYGGTPDFRTNSPSVAVQTTPANDQWVNDTTPTLTAQQTDVDGHTGVIQFDLCATNAADPWSATCGGTYQTLTSGSIANSATTTFTPTTLPEGDRYWRVRSTDQLGVAGAWSVRRVRVDITPPTNPSNVAIAASGPTSADLTWTAATDALSGVTYDVEYSGDGTTWAAQCTAIAGLVCSRTGMAANEVVVMRVRACDGAGNCSGWHARAGASGGQYFLRSTVNSARLTNAANKLADTASGTANTTTSVLHAAQAAGWYYYRPNVADGTRIAAEPANTAANTNIGRGWVIDSTLGKTITPGDIDLQLTVTGTVNTGVGTLQCRAFRVTTAGGLITAQTFIGKGTSPTADVLATGTFARTCTAATLASNLVLAPTEAIYIEVLLNVTTIGAAGNQLRLSTEGTASWVSLPPTGTLPTAPTPLLPVNLGTANSLTPTTTATYNHPTPTNGFVEFEIATANTFGATTVQSGTSLVVANAATGSYTLATLTNLATYYWRVRGIDLNGLSSGWSATRSFTVNDTSSIGLVLDFTTVNMGMQTANIDDYASFTATVTTTNPSGYNLTALGGATGPNGTDCSSCLTPFDDWTGTSANPSPWVATTSGPNGYAGITVRDALGGRDSLRWGAGTATAESSAANDYAGLGSVSPVLLHNRATAAGAGDPVVVTWRLTPSTTTSSATHSEVITVTATANP